ncbi:hypothetical protein PR048_016696 [Dryococelus australis]|uniref:Uncharacterized protein n=1 Tax=Dryococelus australis TaxID=614101 RepID=A0ABQ9H7G0_9NEOP|nr:hypothetical protein PR048_016696 [Dryococelus australis]
MLSLAYCDPLLSKDLHLCVPFATVGLFTFRAIARLDSPLRWQPTITPLSKSDISVPRAISLSTGSSPAYSVWRPDKSIDLLNYLSSLVPKYFLVDSVRQAGCWSAGGTVYVLAKSAVMLSEIERMATVQCALRVTRLWRLRVNAQYERSRTGMKRGGLNGRSPSKPADQRLRPARFPHPLPGIEPGSPLWEDALLGVYLPWSCRVVVELDLLDSESVRCRSGDHGPIVPLWSRLVVPRIKMAASRHHSSLI